MIVINLNTIGFGVRKRKEERRAIGLIFSPSL